MFLEQKKYNKKYFYVLSVISDVTSPHRGEWLSAFTCILSPTKLIIRFFPQSDFFPCPSLHAPEKVKLLIEYTLKWRSRTRRHTSRSQADRSFDSGSLLCPTHDRGAGSATWTTGFYCMRFGSPDWWERVVTKEFLDDEWRENFRMTSSAQGRRGLRAACSVRLAVPESDPRVSPLVLVGFLLGTQTGGRESWWKTASAVGGCMCWERLWLAAASC